MRKIFPLLLLCSAIISAFNAIAAPVTGTKTIGTDYATLALAIADLNTNGISGNVIINVPAGYTETAPAGGLKLGSAALTPAAGATLTFQKSGAGTNPLITAPVGTSTTVDGIFFIQGTDYVTIDGIDLAESAGNTTATQQMEFGYALVKRSAATPFDGCQYVTIKNCTITLNKSNTVSVGIYSGNHVATSTTALTITATSDAMNNCSFQSNTITNCNTGISLRGYSTAGPLYDQNNTVGGSATTGNTITNYAGTAAGSGVNLQYQNSAVVSYNNINNTAGGGTSAGSTLYGVYVQNGTNTNVDVNSNTLNLTQGSTSTLYEVYVGCSGTGTVNVNSNTITANGGSSGTMYMIYLGSANNVVNTNNNNFANINIATTSTVGLIYHASSATSPTIVCSGNYTSGSSTPYVNRTGTSGTLYGYYNNSGASGGYTLISNNNFSNITQAGSAVFYGVYDQNGGTGQNRYVRNCIFSNINSGTGSLYGVHQGYSATQSVSNCQIYNFTTGGSIYGVDIASSTTTDTVNNCRISNLTSTGGSVYGIYATSSGTTLRFYGDTINTLSTSYSSGLAYGIYQTVGTTVEISKNRLYDISASGTGSSVNGMYLNAGTVTVWNNLVGDLRTPNYNAGSANSGTQLVGIYCGSGTAHSLYYNTVYLNGTSSGANFGSTAVYAATSNVTFRNNIFINVSTPAGTGMVTAYRRSATGLTGFQAATNNNLYYAGTPAANQSIMYDGTNTYQTLAAYKTAVASRDAQSLTENVTFQSVTGGGATFLMPSTTIATQLESAGANIAGITDDIYGTVRAGNAGYTGTGVAPDLGAVEGNYIPLDFSAPAISYTPFAFTCTTGDRVLTATITDVTGVPTTGTLMPRIYYKKNSGAWFSSQGVLASGTGNVGTWSFTIVSSDMGGVASGDVVSYFVIAQDVASTPNIGSVPAGAVASTVNSITTYPTTPNTYNVSSTLAGSYNVGAGGDFATITAAVTAYNNSCLGGAVTFVLTDATYPSETYPMPILANSYASATNTLTIRPASGVAVNISGNTSAVAMFKLLDAKYITIDGVNTGGSSLTLTNNNTGTTANVWLAAGAAAGSGNNNIALKNMTLIGGVNSNTNVFGIIAGIDAASPSGTAGMDNDNITVTGNTFKKMGYAIRAVGTAATSAGGLDNWTISNNIIGPSTYSSTDNIGYNGMFLQGMLNVTISGNTMQNIGLTSATYQVVGVYMPQTINGLTITQNNFNNIMSAGSTSGTSSNSALYLGTTVINATITRNTIYSIWNQSASGYGARGIILNTATAASNIVIANNFISDVYCYADASNIYWAIGIDIDGSTGGVKVYYNSVNLFGNHTGLTSATGSACLFVNTTSNAVDVRDNIFVNTYDNTTSTTDKGWAIYSAVANTVFSNIDYNDYYVAGPNVLGNIGATDRPALTDVVTGFGGNTHSISILPTFVSTTDLHLQAITANSGLIAGTALAGFTTDYDGTTRHATLPVIGAHELSLPTAPPTIAYTPLAYTCVSADRTVTATISSATTGVPTTGTLRPRIYYRKNSGSWFSQPGTLASGDGTLGTWTFNITVSDMGGTVNGDSVYYYVIAQTNGGIVGSSPAAGLAATDVNTVTTPPTSPNFYLMVVLGGTYTVGSGGNYPTITAALNAYNGGCLTSAVTFVLTDATYPSETYPLTILNNANASATNTLTIKPAAGVAVSIGGSASAVAVFKLLNAKYITIDGLNTGGSSLTLTNNNTSTSANTCNIWLAAGSAAGSGNNNISLKNMTIIGGVNSSTNNQGIVAGIDGASPASTAGMDNDNVTIQGNTFKRMGYAVRAIGTAATSSGGLDNWNISNNIIGPSSYSATDNIGYNGMFLQSMLTLAISGNTIQNVGLTSSTTQSVGIYFSSNINGAVVTQNNINNVTATASISGTSSVCGLYFGSAVINTTVSRNTLTSISNNATGGYGGRGMILNTGNASSNITIVNNFISDVSTYSDVSNLYWPIGIALEGTTGGVQIYYNSVNLFGSHPGLTSATGSACLFLNSSVTAVDVRDNIFSNTYDNSTSSSEKGWSIYTSTANTAFTNIDYNDYYVGGPNVLGYISSDRATLSDIIAGFGGNTHSINVQPTFVSNTDLHLQAINANAPIIAGTPIAGYTTDIDGTTRNTVLPVIGAHEVNIPTAPPTISYSLLGYTCVSADRTLTASIGSASSGVPTTGTLVPRVYYRKNGGTWYSQPGTLTSGTGTLGTWTFNIVVADMGGTVNGDSISYYVIAQTNLGVVGASPSAGLVATDVNTVTTHPTAPNKYAMAILGGTYTVGAGGNYTTLTAAVNAYNNSCLSGNVTFVLTDATYPSETYPITILNNTNASATATLTIKPAAGVAVNLSGSTTAVAMFKMLNAKYVTLDGLNTGGSSLTLTNNNTGTAVNFWLAAGSAAGSGNNFITLKNMTIIGGINSSTNNQGILAGIDGITPANTAGMDNDNITITGNIFKRMGYTIRAIGTAAASAGGLDNWTISNNIMGPSSYSATDNIGYNGMFLQSMLNLTISGNTMQNIGLTSASYQVVGVYMPSNITGLTISQNNFNNIMSAGSTSGTSANCALYLGTSVINANITGNTINTIWNQNTSGYSARGIVMNTGNTASNILIANNMISDIYSYSNTTNSYWPMGIDIDGSTGGVKVYYNSINLFGAHVGLNAATGSACLFVNTTGTTLDVRDNIFVNNYDNSSSTTDKGWAIYSAVSNTVFSSIDYNDYYAASPNVLGNIGGTDRTTLANIVTGFGGNANSLSVQPVFVSNTDLHLQLHAGNVPLKAGTTIAAVTTDKDGDTRNTPPVVGADEVIIPNCSGTPTAGTVTASATVGCGTFASNLNLSGSTFLPGITYQWETSTDNVTYTAVSGATNQAYAASVPSTIYYRATLTCTVSGLSASTAGLQLTVNPVPAISGTLSVCNGSSTTLGASLASGTWISNNGTVATIGSATGIVNGVAVGTTKITYTVTSTGCNAISVFTVNPTPLPLAISPAASAICATGPAQLLTAQHDSVILSANFGTQQNVNTSTTFPAPLTVWYGGQRVQMLVLASELTAAGYTSGINFSSIEMGVVSVGASYVGNNNFQVRIAPTSLTSLTSFVTTGLVTVRDPSTYVAAAGNNVIPFTTPYAWDGTSNLIVDMTFSNNLGGTSAMGVIQYNTNTSFPSMVIYYADNVTAATAASATTISASYSARSDFKLKAAKQVPVTWASTSGLFTDASASTAYTGTTTRTVYALPTATTVYTATSTFGGCTSTATATVTVNPLPADIAGANTVCVGSTTTLTNDTTGGTWSSSLPANATVGATTGVVTGISAGVVTMTYTRTASGCFKTMQMTVNPLPAAIAGTTGVCESATTTLTSADAGGTWSSDGTSIAVVASSTGVVTGIAAGFAQITYTLPTTCRVMQQVTVNPVPSASITPTPVPDLCYGATTTLTASSTMNEFALMSQDFNAGLGAWTITNIDGSAASYWQIISSPSSSSGATGDGTPMLQASPFDYSGITNTIITSPSFSTVGYGAVTLSFNEYLLSLSSSDATVKVEYSTDGTSWNTVLDQLNEMVGTGAWSSSSPEVSVALPAGALGQPNVKLRWNYNSNFGLWWNVDNVKVTAAQPAPSYTWAGAAGLSCTSCTTVNVTPTATGANVYSLTATTTAGCAGTVATTVSVNPLPSAIGGTLVVCEGLTTTATDADAGGTWSTAATSIATIDGTTGVITGVSGGNAEITYTLPTGCITTATVTVNPLPSAIDGVVPVCQGLTITLSDVDGGGTWSSSNTAIAGIDAAGVVTGNSNGNATVTYTLPTGCIITAEMTVNPLPATIGGTKVVCEGLTTTLTDADAGGTWSSTSSAIAGIGSASGIVTGNSAGTTDVTYTLPTGCITTATVTVNHTPVAISGTLQACEGATSSLSNTDGGGTWSTSAASIANIDASGVVTAGVAGTATITYTLPTGCLTTSVFTVNAMPAAITGTMVVCQGVSTTLADATSGGTWSTTATSIATVGSSTGVVTGVSAGIAQVSYTMPGGCYMTADVTVNASPATIGGTPRVCVGSVTTLTDADPGGTWSSGATGVATVSSTGVVSGVSMGTATITYALSAGCIVTTVATVDPLPAPIAGPSQLCAGATGTFTDGTPAGTWSSSTTAVATIDNTTGVANAIASGSTIITYTSAAGCVRTRVLTVNALPAAITGPSEVCKASTIALADATAGGTWSSSAGGIATINAAGTLSGVSDGVATITYTLSTGCIAVTNVTVNPLPMAISGTTSMCLGQSTSLTNGLAGGTWNSSNTANALVDMTSGVVTGIGVGSSVISYTMPTGCSKSVVVVVNAVPSAITGATNVCQGATTTMANATTGGVWTSSTTSVASINLTTGVVTGLAAGTTNISYTLTAGGCSATYTISVDAMPSAFTGALTVCNGLTTTLGAATTGGTWSSSNTAVATIATTGVVTGVAAGTSVITYALPSGCVRTAIVSVNALPAVHSVTGGGSYCMGGSGVHIGLDNSNGGVNYQLYLGAGTVGSPVAGVTGMPVDFGSIAAIGSYSVVGTSATTGCSSNMTGVATVSVSSTVPASVSFTTSTGSDTVCSGIPVTFTATAVNGGTTPVYQWRVNGVVMGTASNTYTYTPAAGDVVAINMSSSIACATPSTATASRTMVVNTSVIPVAGITVLPGASICEGSSALFTASSLYGGSAPVYIWYKNGTAVFTGSTYSYIPSTGDNVYVRLVSNQACAIEDSVSSSIITMTVSPVFLPVVTINATPGTMVETGTSVTMTATVTNAGPSPEYQWFIGTSAMAGATSATFTYSGYVNGDSVSCRVKGTGACGLDGFNSLIMHVAATGITATPGVTDIRLMPNPNKGEFAVKGTLSVKEDKEVAIEVTNMLGQVVYRTNVMARGGIVDTRIKLDNTLANGMYMLNMISGDDRKVFHFVLEQ